MLFITPGAAEFISGAIVYDETIRQMSADGTPFAQVLARWGIVPGIKVDTGAELLAGFPDGGAPQDAAMAAWHGRDENRTPGQRAFYHRARCNSTATRGEYTDQMEAG